MISFDSMVPRLEGSDRARRSCLGQEAEVVEAAGALRLSIRENAVDVARLNRKIGDRLVARPER